VKILVFKVDTQKKPKKRKTCISVEQFLFTSFLVAFAIMVFVQIALLKSGVRTFLSVDTGFEGSPLEVEEYLFEEGIVVIRLLSHSLCNDLKILVNGSEAARFTENELIISVKDGDVIEIDGSNIDSSVEVSIVSTSSNVQLDSTSRQFKIKSVKKKLARVRVK
jgi:hypothetical protein